MFYISFVYLGHNVLMLQPWELGTLTHIGTDAQQNGQQLLPGHSQPSSLAKV